jgi:anaerobic magnesium-protoporphyrin IX monomethyl ester cyclase
MRFALINPPWSFEGSIYFGCREPHLPLEFGYAKLLLEQQGQEVLLLDAHLQGLTAEEVYRQVCDYQPEVIAVTTAPTYLFWRCPPPELRVPQTLFRKLREIPAKLIAVGPHGSTTPQTALKKLKVDAVILGECEEVLAELAAGIENASSIAYLEADGVVIRGPNRATDLKKVPALRWPDLLLARHSHHHHRFDAAPRGPGAEMEASRGCPYHCTFCAKENFRNRYRKRPLEIILAEVDQFIAQGVEYIYFIDEIFLPDAALLRALAEREVKIGVQTRIDLWNEESIRALARAGCVSIEAGIESISENGRAYLDKKCKLSTEQLTERLIFAKELIPFVQANLLAMAEDDAEAVERWREELQRKGVWANQPVPLFPYPGSPEYTRRWGVPDELAWERAHASYLQAFAAFSDIQEQEPQSLVELENACYGC